MKKRMFSLFLAVLLATLSLIPAVHADSGVVVCVNATINGQANYAVEGTEKLTAIATLADGECVERWEINGQVVEGETNPWLVFEANSTMAVVAYTKQAEASEQPAVAAAPEVTAAPEAAAPEAAPTAEPTVEPTVEPTAEPAPVDQKLVKAIGCTLKFLSSSGKAGGSAAEEIDFTEAYVNGATKATMPAGKVSFNVTATIPRGKKISYWVINGVRYDFAKTVKTFTVTGLTESMTIEAVMQKGTAETLLTAEEIQAARTGETLTVSVVNGTLRYATDKQRTGGGDVKSIDFTNDYKNKATKKKVAGGSVNVKAKTNAKTGQKTTGWKFNEATFTFEDEMKYFFATGLNCSMVYEALVEDIYVNITCSDCTFSGGGYSAATSGKVKYGTSITVTGKSLGKMTYPVIRVNGVPRYAKKSATLKVKGYMKISFSNMDIVGYEQLTKKKIEKSE